MENIHNIENNNILSSKIFIIEKEIIEKENYNKNVEEKQLEYNFNIENNNKLDNLINKNRLEYRKIADEKDLIYNNYINTQLEISLINKNIQVFKVSYDDYIKQKNILNEKLTDIKKNKICYEKNKELYNKMELMENQLDEINKNNCIYII